MADDLNAFIEELARAGSQVLHAVDRIAKEATNDLAREIVIGGSYSPGTPVASGAARGHWGASIDGNGGPPPFLPSHVDPAGDATLGAIHQSVLGAPLFAEVGLTNSAPYIENLENGLSGQAPEGMVRLAVAQWEPIATAAAERVIRQELV
jgi:hypothetical protein